MPRVLLIAVLFVTGCVFLKEAYSIGMANAYYFQVKAQLENWQEQKRIHSEAEFKDALTTIDFMQSHDSDNPHYWHIRGKVLHWGAYSGLIEDEKALLNEAKLAYQKAIELRESWPMVWGDIALVNHALQGFNSETAQYINMGLKYGPYESEVILVTLEIYFANWSSLTAEQKQQLFDLFGRLGRKTSSIFAIARTHNKLSVTCNYIKYAKQFEHVYKSYDYRRACS